MKKILSLAAAAAAALAAGCATTQEPDWQYAQPPPAPVCDPRVEACPPGYCPPGQACDAYGRPLDAYGYPPGGYGPAPAYPPEAYGRGDREEYRERGGDHEEHGVRPAPERRGDDREHREGRDHDHD